MALADTELKMTLQKVHPGGYFWNVARGDRDQLVLRLATEAKQLVVIAHSTAAAKHFAQRLTLSGLPVFVAVDPSRKELVKAELSKRTNTVVTTSEYVLKHGPIEMPLAIHLRAAQTARVYARMVEAVLAKVHITFITAEDLTRAASLVAQLRSGGKDGDVPDISLEDVIDLTDGAASENAAVANFRRRFPLRP